MIVEIEVLPKPPGVAEDPYRHVEAAIAAVTSSGVHYEVSALGTTFETTPDEAWALSRRVHDACLEAGAASVITIIKAAQWADDAGPSMDDLTGKFRN